MSSHPQSRQTDSHLIFPSILVYVWIHVLNIYILRFFFFFFSRVLAKRGYCLYTVPWTVTAKSTFLQQTVYYILFMDPQILFLVTFSLKMGPTVLFTHLKIILLQ